MLCDRRAYLEDPGNTRQDCRVIQYNESPGTSKVQKDFSVVKICA